MFDEKILIDNGVDLEKSLELFGDIATYNDNLDEFLDGVEKLTANLTKYKNEADMNNYAILVHSLKSDAKYYGFVKLAELSLNHELNAKDNNIEYIRNNFESLMSEIKRVEKLVRDYLGINYEKNEIISDTSKSNEISILVVDDSNIISNFVTKIFSNDYNVIVSKDGKEAIDQLSDNKNILAMLLDINMPNVNGYEVLKFMKTNDLFRNINVAIISGTDSKEILSSVTDYPIKAILEKPFNEENIKRIVDMIIKR